MDNQPASMKKSIIGLMPMELFYQTLALVSVWVQDMMDQFQALALPQYNRNSPTTAQ